MLLAWGVGVHALAAPLTLQNDQVAVELNPANGAITRLTDRLSGIDLAPPAALAENFRLGLRFPDQTTALILGREQKLSASRIEGNTLSLTWEGPLQDTAGATHDVGARMVLKVEGAALTATLQADNRTQAKLREAWYPLIGGLSRLGDGGSPGSPATVWMPSSTPIEKPITLPHTNVTGIYPQQLNLSFACLQSRPGGRSIYWSAQDPVARLKFYHVFQVDGPDSRDVFSAVQFHPFTPPGATFDGPPVVSRFVDGGWKGAAQVYRDWFVRTFGIASPSTDWVRQQSFYLMTMFMLPEGTITYRFKDIPRWAKSAKRHGINAVQISGWQQGGHDNGYPDYTPDSRLGTWDELREGIRACHRMGLKVYFFVNYQPMMVESEWYRNDLKRYREMTEDGGYTWMAGWGMGTLSARTGHPKLMTWANLAFPQFRRIIADQFAKLAEIGADGVHVDKMFPAGLEYNPDSPLSPDTAAWEGAVRLTEEVMRECRKRNPGWAMSFECNWDRMLQFGGATWWVGNQRITRQVFPENAETLGLYQAYDYLGLNLAVRDGHIVMVAPMNFCRDLDWPPFQGLAEYIKQVKRIRDELQDTVFLGEVLGPSEVEFGTALPEGVAYNTFRHRHTGRRACIFTNDRNEPRTVDLTGFTGPPGGPIRVHVPGHRARSLPLPATFTVPAERLLFVEECGGAR